jgi:hypothetical protein
MRASWLGFSPSEARALCRLRPCVEKDKHQIPFRPAQTHIMAVLTQVTQLAGRIGVLSSDKADSWQKSSLHLYDFVDAAQPLRQRQA